MPTNEDLARLTGPGIFQPSAFRDRVYGVTGAGMRIGEALVRSLAQLEARVVLVDINEERLNRVEGDLRDSGAAVRSVLGDVGERAVLERAVDTAVETWGRVDGWVNNAPANKRAGLVEQTDEEAEHVWRVNVEAARIAVQRLVPTMKAQGSGSIINVSSILAHQTRGWDAVYAGAKAALEALTRSWAMELGEWGVRVNCIRPGDTHLPPEFGEGELGELRQQAYWAHIHAKRPLQMPTLPRDVANAMLFLLSDASVNITGTVLPVDGGMGVEYHTPDNPRRLAARREKTKLYERIRELESQDPTA